MRWRLNAFPADVAVKDLEDEIEAFAVEALQVARLYGEMEVLAGMRECIRQQDGSTL